MECPMCSKKLQLIKKYDMTKLKTQQHSTSPAHQTDEGYKPLSGAIPAKKN